MADIIPTRVMVVRISCRLFVFAIVALAAPTSVAAQSLPRTVLILDQSGADSAWFRVFYPAFQATLNDKATTQISVYTEHLDLNRFSGPRRDDVLRTFLRDKYSETPIGVIVAQGSGALDFVMRTPLWPDTPVVIAAVDDTTIARLKPPPNVTGATYRYTFRDIVASAKMLVPNLKRLALVGQRFETQSYNSHFNEELPAATAGFDVIDLLGLPMADVLKRVAALPEDTAIIYTGIDIDGAGVVYYPPEALKIISQNANRPIAIGVSSWVGFGGTGGLITSAGLVGADAAERVVRVLAGEKPSDTPIVKGNFTQPIFDWRELQRFGVDERNLPKDSEIRFRPLTFWAQYRWLAITGITILLAQTLMISGLLIEHRRRRFAEADAQRHLLEVTHLNRTAALSVMSTSIAHELGQPLGAIQNSAESAKLFLNKNPPALERVEQILTNISRDNQRAADIISRIRGLLKKKDAIELQEFDLNDVARDALQIVRVEAKERRVEIDDTLANCALPVRGDRVHLQQVIINLAMNGLDAMENCAAGNRRMSVQTALADVSTLKFLVIDSGPGIPADKLNQVFDAFYTTKRRGTGLGLSIAREIVEASGGKIWAENRPGGGGILCFTLPLSKNA